MKKHQQKDFQQSDTEHRREGKGEKLKERQSQSFLRHGQT